MLEGLGPLGQWLGPIGGIILADLVLSGDNALIIGAAASGLPKQQRWWAIMLGGGGAIVLRILFAFMVVWLLAFPLLQAIGGVVLLYIAIKLLLERNHDKHPYVGEVEVQKKGATSKKKGFFAALMTILIADVTMSLDNVLAVGALAHGNLTVLAIGLILSIIILLLGSALISSLIQRLPWLLDVASIALGWTAADMILKDARLIGFFEQYPWTHIALPVACIAFVVIVDIYLLLRARRKKAEISREMTTEEESQAGAQADIKV